MAWDKPRGGSPAVTSYLVWYRARGSATSTNKVVATTQVTMVSLLPYTVYDIKVQGWNQNGKGQWSDIRSLMTAESGKFILFAISIFFTSFSIFSVLFSNHSLIPSFFLLLFLIFIL